jgi:hypothetical protein
MPDRSLMKGLRRWRGDRQIRRYERALEQLRPVDRGIVNRR